MPGPSSSTQGKDSRPRPRSLEELMDAPAAPDPEALLSERGEQLREDGRELLRRLRMPLSELIKEMGS